MFQSKLAVLVVFPLVFLMVFAAMPGHAAEKRHAIPSRRHFFSPDREMRAVIVADDPQPHRRSAESRVLIYRGDGHLANVVDYSSPDGNHGFGVVKAAWTPDSQFFVYSMTSSGGHQSWKSPTYFYSRKTNKTQGIEETLGKPVLSPNFTVSAPSTVTVATWRKPPLNTAREITEDLRLANVSFNPAAQPVQPRTLATPVP